MSGERGAAGRKIGAITVLLAMFWAATECRAAVTLVEGEKGKLDIELRLMVLAVDNGPELLPGINTAPPPPQEENITDFSVRRARLILRAQMTKSLEIGLQIGQDNIGSKVLRDDGGFRVKDALINYKKNDALQLMAGQFKVPFLRQNLQSGFNQLLVDRSLVTGLRPAIEGSRDQGGMIWGNRRGLQYRVALFDGSDQEDTATHSTLRGAARVSWNWFTPEPTYGLSGTTLGEKRILQVGVQGDAQNGRLDSRDSAAFAAEPRAYRNWAVDFFYDQPFRAGVAALTIEGAWLQRRDDYDAPGLATRSIAGDYLQTGMLIPGHLGPGRVQFSGRYERIHTERGSVDADLKARTFGLTWFTTGHDRKIQLDHIDSHERPTDLDDNVYRLSLVACF